MSGTYSFENMKDRLDFLWKTCVVQQEHEKFKSLNAAISLILQQKNNYLIVAEKTGVPWYLIAALHSKECSSRMSHSLHNGEPWSKVTTLVPKGRGPFNSWVESAIDALTMKKALFPNDGNWTIERVLYFALCYNGLGYNVYHPEINSPYLWSGTNHYIKGGYVADGKWDSEHIIKNHGVAVLINILLGAIPAKPISQKPEPTIKIPETKIRLTFWQKIKSFFNA